MIVVLGLLLNVACIILGWTFSMIFSDLKAQELWSVPAPSSPTLTEFFNENDDAYVYIYIYIYTDICVGICIG